MTITFNYDPWRGGFSLRLLKSGHVRVQSVFDNLMSIYLNAQNQILGIESFFGDHGGIPLRGLHKTDEFPKGVFQIEGGEVRTGSFQLRQSEKKLEVWFSTGNELPRAHWTKQHDKNLGLTAWFSSQKAKGGWPVPGVGKRVEIYMLAGLAVEFCRTAVTFPISSVHIAVEDFK